MSMMNKVTESVSVFSQIKDNCVIAISGFNLATTPEYLILELYRHYNEFGHPKNMFIVSDALPAVTRTGLLTQLLKPYTKMKIKNFYGVC